MEYEERLSTGYQIIFSKELNLLYFTYKPATICYEVPHGYILGTLFYLIYVDDIHVAISQILSFADDTSLFLSNTNLDILFHDANIEMNKFHNLIVQIKFHYMPTKPNSWN